jgi:succinyl-CoA synthetase beta subunit
MIYTMLLLEYEAKAALAEVGIPIPEGVVVRRPQALPGAKLVYPVAVKAQVASGGRGKAGGVIRADSARAAADAVAALLDREFAGERPRAALVERWLPVRRELYLSLTIDAAAEGYVLLYSARGGVDVEDRHPPARYAIGRLAEFRAHRLRAALVEAERDPGVRERVIDVARRIVTLAARQECTTVEINPLAVLDDDEMVAADAKVVRDEHAAFRNPGIAARIEREHRRERRPIARALAGRLMLVWLDGSVGLVSGGAGMTMATIDLVADRGGKAACFLDCSNNPTPHGYGLAFDLLDRERQVKVILVSIFGGLTQMDRVARVLCDIMDRRRSTKPVVFRLNGTNAREAEDILTRAGLHNHPGLEEAIDEAVALATRKRKR